METRKRDQVNARPRDTSVPRQQRRLANDRETSCEQAANR